MSISTQSQNQINYKNRKMQKSLPKIISPSNKNLNLKNQSSYDSSYSTDFFIRNYDNYLEKIKQRNKINSTLKSELELNSFLFKLKNYYSEVVAVNKKKNDSIIFLKQLLNFEEFKLNQVIEFQNIELPDERISIKNINEFKLTKKEVERQLKNLMKEKQHLEELIKNASEYFRTIEYMCEEEKNRLKEIKCETNVVEERIHNVNQYQRIVDYNIGKEKIKLTEEKKMEDKLGKGMELMEDINIEQKIKNEKINKMISEKEKKVEELKIRLLELKKLNKMENKEYQNEIKRKIEKGKEFGGGQKIKEKKIAEIIYCLYLIQNYFINEENFDRKKMMNSNEYKLLEKKYFDINLNDNKKTIQLKCITHNDNVQLPISPSFSEKKLDYKFNLDKNEEKKVKIKENKSEESEESENEEESKKDEDKNEQMPSIFLTNLKKKLSLKSFPMQILEIQKENKEKEKSQEPKRSNSFKDKKSDIFIYMNNIENKKKKIKKKKEKSKSKERAKEKEKKVIIETNNNMSRNNNLIQNSSSNYTNNAHSDISKKMTEIEIPSLEELKEKFALIKINRKTLFNYNSQLTSKLYFYKNQINLFHKKELELEDKKSLSTQKASKVIQQNFIAFKQLVKLKPEVNKFIKSNRELIEKIKNEDKKKKIKEMNKTIVKMNPINNEEITQENNMETNSENNKYDIDIHFNENMDLLISSSNKIIMANKDFFMKCKDYLNQIKTSIDAIINSDKKEGVEEYIPEMKEYIKKITEEENELDELIKRMIEKNSNDKKDLVNYIQNLINYSQQEEELKKMFDINDLNNDLLYQFYKDLQKKKIKGTFYKQFKLKHFPEMEKEFNYYSSISEDLIKHFKKLTEIVNDLEKNEKLNKIINQKSMKGKKRNREMTKVNPLISINNKNIIIPQGSKINNLRYIQKNRVFSGFKTVSLSTQKDTSYSELEFMSGGKIDEDDILDNYTKKRKIIVKKKKTNSIEENIVNKLYSPFLKKTSYLRKLNKNMKGIKSMTTLNCQANHTLRKKKVEVDITTHQMYIYNNPLINLDKLTNQTYNSLVGLAVRKQNKYKYDENYLNPNLIY